MQQQRITLPDDPTLVGIRQDLVCEGFAVSFTESRIIPVLFLEQFFRTQTEVPAEDGSTTIVYGEWQPYKRFYPSGRVSIPTESNNIKRVDPATFELVESGGIGEVDAIWSQFGGPISVLLGTLMNRMIQRGNLNDLSQL
ncbi:hypothetical protein [Arsenicibacter rosenii]|uniref:Uncharacterized protein n=1 Tax=Arsenicibacter rosenii TaxID=1750698 RepID=A0A1S2VFU6_9BACT|nr:hypothetical protein [Arsenicibacter rosenii]OIN57627.1 hypothetical protein BLX24_19315 [Arsenicibacter rosenii]